MGIFQTSMNNRETRQQFYKLEHFVPDLYFHTIILVACD